MRLGLQIRKTAGSSFGGDTVALRSIERGLKTLGIDSLLSSSIQELKECDHFFVTNSFTDHLETLQEIGTFPYSVIGFHESRDRFVSEMDGFSMFIHIALNHPDNPLGVTIDEAIHDPNCYKVFPYFMEQVPSVYPLLKNAKVCIANSKPEACDMLKVAPESNVHVVKWAPGIAEGDLKTTRDFLDFTGLESGSYMLQIGRLSSRKNQFATLLATRNIDMPLVLIATPYKQKWYEEDVIKLAKRVRKGKTILISQEHADLDDGNLMIRKMPGGAPLGRNMLLSALAHAALQVHVPFCELPGYTYLEALKVGCPTIASTGTTIHDYIDDFYGHFAFSNPTDIQDIEKKIKSLLGKKFIFQKEWTALHRKSDDVAKELVQCLEKNKAI